MQIFEFLDDVISLRNPFDPETTIFLVRNLSIFLINIAAYSYIFVKFFKVLCYSKMTFEWLPMINPYVWPFSVFQVVTGPYFAFWAKVLPSIKLDKSSLDISGVIALEVLNSLIYFFVLLTNMLVVVLEGIEKDAIKNM
jgi:hypothetical protein